MLRLLAPPLALVTLGLISPGTAGPPDSTTPDSSTDADSDPAAAAFERQLAELSFGTFLALELGLSPQVFTCTEPRPTEADDTVTCFALADGQRVVIATSTASGGTGRFTFHVVADYELVEPGDTAPPESAPATDPADSPADTAADSTPVTYSSSDRNEANVAVLVYGDELDRSASTEIGAVVAAANGSILAVSTWRWNASTATFTIDYTLNGGAGLDADESAWLTASAMGVHWEEGQPFREPAATIRPSLTLVVSGARYVSSWDLMTEVADGAITDTDWLTAARQT